MSTKVIVGAQWGDEGKGKIIDIFAQQSEVEIRAQGGNNAGHTVMADGETHKLHLIPSGSLNPETLNIVGNGVVVDPQAILQEIDMLESRGISTNNLKVDLRAHIIMPYHKEIDALSEEKKKDNKIGTTKKGIGPCYMDKAERSGLRLYDLVNDEIFIEKATFAIEEKNEILEKIYGAPKIDAKEVIKEYLAYGQRLKSYAADTTILVFEAYKAGKKILFEGAQGTLLDIDLGTYPYVTSSHPISGGVCIGTGMGPAFIEECIGVAKAYTTRVGEGPFPTELLDDIGNTIREKGFEFGTTTGRPRRCGWLDLVILKYAVRINSLTSVVVNKMDTLSGLGDLKVCVGYDKDGEIISEFPATIEELAKCKPVYKTLPGWDEDIQSIKNFDDLPENAKKYIYAIEETIGCKVAMIGVGPGRTQNINR